MARFSGLAKQYFDSNGDPLSNGVIDHESLLMMVAYDPDTGVMTRRVPSGTAKAGDVMGSPRKDGYLAANVGGVPRLVHRLAWFYVHGEWPDCIDHINHDRSDNRLCNLRSVSRQENQKNLAMRSDNKHGITGVSWDRARRMWSVQITASGESEKGRYPDFFEACCARKSAEARLGFHENHGGAA